MMRFQGGKDPTTQIWIVMKQSTNLELKDHFKVEMNVKDSHTHNNNHRLQKLAKRSQQSD